MSDVLAAPREAPSTVHADAVEELALPLLELAANILRVVRGSGRADEIARQCSAVVQQFIEYRNVVGRLPADHEVAEALRLPERPGMADRRSPDRQRAVDQVVRGALQIAASALLDQKAQQAKGEAEVMAGMRSLRAPIGEQAV